MFIIVIIIVMMVVMLMLIFVIIIVVMVVVMLMLIFVIIIIVVMVVVMLMFIFILVVIIVTAHDFFKDLSLKVRSALDRGEDLFAVELGDGSCNDRSLIIVLAKDFDALRDLFIADFIGPCKNDRAGKVDLVDKEFTEILDIKLAL